MNQPDTEQLRREIERTRAELGATVEALSQKTDVKAHARAKAEQAKTQAREKAELAKSQAQEKPVVPIAAGVGVAIGALLLILRKRRS
jgi:Protein of unknown function (DUF3618)